MLSTIQAQEWEQKTNLPGTGRDHPVGFAINDTGYIVVGSGVENFSYQDLDDFYRYIPESGEWQQLAAFPGKARGYSIGIAHQGKGYVGFGDGPNDTLLNDLWEYDPKTDQWTKLSPCPCSGRQHPVLEASEGNIYVGLGNDNSNLDDWWTYDIATDSWTQLPDLPGPPRHHPYHFSINGKIYAGMGDGGFGNIYDDWYRYNPDDSTWTEMSQFPGQGRVAGTQFALNGKGFVLSGDGSDHGPMHSGQFWMYHPETDEWEELPPHPGDESIWAPTNFLVNDHVYLVAGYNKNKEIHYDSVFSFNLTNTTTSIKETRHTNKGFEVFPNPAYQKLHFKEDFEASQLQILNANGQVLKSQSDVGNQLEVADLANGLYLLRAKDEKGEWHQTRFLKK